MQVIHSINCTRVHEHPHWFTLDIKAQAGTYIKELCHGDMGRTTPSVGQLLGDTEVQIAELDVTHIDFAFPPPNADGAMSAIKSAAAASTIASGTKESPSQ